MEDLVRYAYGLASKLCTNDEDARDLAQEALTRAWASRDQVRDPGAKKAWFRRVVVTTHLQNLRRQNPVFEGDGDFDVPTPGPSAAQELDATEEVRALRDGCFLAMARKLTLEQRTVFSLRCMFGLDTDEVADLIGATPGAVRALLHRATGHLNAFFHTHCAWVHPGAECRCEAWLEFGALRNHNRRPLLAAFPSDPPAVVVSDEKRARIWHLYRHLPDRTPDPSWYEGVRATLGA